MYESAFESLLGALGTNQEKDKTDDEAIAEMYARLKQGAIACAKGHGGGIDRIIKTAVIITLAPPEMYPRLMKICIEKDGGVALMMFALLGYTHAALALTEEKKKEKQAATVGTSAI